MIKIISANEEHVDVMLGWRQQTSTVKYNPVKNLNRDELMKSIRSKSTGLSKLVDGSSFLWVGLTEAEEPFGHVSLNAVNTMMWTAEIGYMVGEKFQSKGLGTRFVRQAIEMIFTQTSLRKLYAHIHEENIASRRLIEKLGFKEEGLLREHYLVNGQPANEVFYGLLRCELKL